MMAAHGTSIPTNSDYGSELDIDIRSIASLSDYGPEFDADDIDLSMVIGGLLSKITDPGLDEERPVYLSAEVEQGEDGIIVENEGSSMAVYARAGLRAANRKTSGHRRAIWDVQSSPIRTTMELEHTARSREVWSVPQEELVEMPFAQKDASTRSEIRISGHESLQTAEKPVASVENDKRPPLERFRTKPKKPLSVTDLVSPSWCEIQYFYTLSKYGRKPRTEAMRTGSRIHQTLEEQVHSIVPVQVKSKEDRFGLRLWNMIQGLRCLRETGLTRELEVWGVLEGEVVNGVIDELNYTCPAPEFEEQLEISKAKESGGTVPLGQMKIEHAFANASTHGNDDVGWLGSLEPDRQVYIADVKTRSVHSLPKGASLRPTWMQLMLYRRLLESLSLNTVDAETIFERYDLKPLEPFTETFMLELGGLNDAQDHSESDDVEDGKPSSQPNEVSQHPNLLALWSFMITEIQVALPASSISPILRAEFRYAKTGEIIGNELTVYDTVIAESYVSDVMSWWKGRREAKGVDIEDAFKCRICDFAEECTWRKTKIEEATQKHRRRNKQKGKSAG